MAEVPLNSEGSQPHTGIPSQGEESPHLGESIPSVHPGEMEATRDSDVLSKGLHTDSPT